MRPENKESAAEKIKELRSMDAKDKQDKVKDGQSRRRAGQEGDGAQAVEEPQNGEQRAGGVTWRAPEEFIDVDFTKQEQEFESIVKGPDQAVFKHIPVEGRAHAGRHGQSATAQAQEMLKRAQELSHGPVLGRLQGASDDLYAWAAVRVANEPNITFVELLEDMVQYGLGELAAEAATFLEGTEEAKAGSSRRCVVSGTEWTAEGPGRAQVLLDGQAWAMYDYKEEVQMTEELAGLLGVVVPEVERRQCGAGAAVQIGTGEASG